MNFFEKILHALSGTMETPKLFGAFHLSFVVFMGLLTALFVWKIAKSNDKTFRITVGICWAVAALLEIYKQLIYTFEFENGVSTWDYQWYAFPFQLCSMQLYVLPFVFLLKDGHVRDGAMAFIGTFSLFGGLAVFIYPGDVFVRTIGINLQTMIHHGLQIVLGILMLVRCKDKIGVKFFLKGVGVFVALVIVAQALNAIVPTFTDETFNMFYISWKYDCTLPVLSAIYPHVWYPLFLLMYVVGLSISSALFMLIAVGINKLAQKNKRKNA